ncbi:MAG: hypothetical protein RR213_04465, partial [Raoultibacter sp.]
LQVEQQTRNRHQGNRNPAEHPFSTGRKGRTQRKRRKNYDERTARKVDCDSGEPRINPNIACIKDALNPNKHKRRTKKGK